MGYRDKWEACFMASDLQPTTKLVLHTVRAFMDAHGRDARVSVGEIVRQSSLSRRAVISHLRMAYEAGWLLIDMDDLYVGKGIRQKYDAKIPQKSHQNHTQNTHYLGAPAAPISALFGAPDAKMSNLFSIRAR